MIYFLLQLFDLIKARYHVLNIFSKQLLQLLITNGKIMLIVCYSQRRDKTLTKQQLFLLKSSNTLLVSS